MDVWPCKPLSPAELNRRQPITHGKPAIHAVAAPCSTPFCPLNYFAIKLKVRVCSTPSPITQGSPLRALGAGPLSRFACHVLKALTEGSPRMGVVRPSRALRTKSPMPQMYGPVRAAPVKLAATQPDSPSGNAVPAAPHLHSEATKLLHTSIARDGA